MPRRDYAGATKLLVLSQISECFVNPNRIAVAITITITPIALAASAVLGDSGTDCAIATTALVGRRLRVIGTLTIAAAAIRTVVAAVASPPAPHIASEVGQLEHAPLGRREENQPRLAAGARATTITIAPPRHAIITPHHAACAPQMRGSSQMRREARTVVAQLPIVPILRSVSTTPRRRTTLLQASSHTQHAHTRARACSRGTSPSARAAAVAAARSAASLARARSSVRSGTCGSHSHQW